MKLLILSDANSIHTRKWAKSLKDEGLDIKLFSLFKPNKDILEDYKKNNIEVFFSELKPNIRDLRRPNISKLRYFLSLPALLRAIKTFNPNILHAHYASSYGLLGILTRFRPLIISAWGSDVYFFPKKNKFYAFLLKYIFKNANVVCSTSKVMKNLIERNFLINNVQVVPFGVDTSYFKPKISKNIDFVVGTIKSIEDHNGIDCLVEAAHILINQRNKNIKFIIVGDGTLRKAMEKKASDLKLNEKVKFYGRISHDKVSGYYHKLSIFIAVSTRESFGVSVLEAAACGIPSITSNVGGLIEVNSNNETGLIISANDPFELAEAINKLYSDTNLRFELGINARKRVQKYFEWNENVNQMISIYESCYNEKK